ncbi:MAG: Rpn family recombination-promoting nuclease/putative transposase [Erysipelotrichaceae bacterium]
MRAFLNDILDLTIEKVSDIEIENSENVPEHQEDKMIRMDIKVKTKAYLIDIEIQIKNEVDSKQRALYYLNKMGVSSVKKADSYYKAKKCILLQIYDHIETDEEGYHHIVKYYYESGNVYDDTQIIHIIELPKIKQGNVKSKEMRWMKYLSIRDKIDLEKVRESEPMMKEAVDKLVYVSSDEQIRARYDALEDARIEYNSRMLASNEMGVEKGSEETRTAIARKMKEESLDISLIAKITGLSVNEVEKL